jgi:catechol 2,3-dioxygenase-like lactoylglutathione lyase family enzyme
MHAGLTQVLMAAVSGLAAAGRRAAAWPDRHAHWSVSDADTTLSAATDWMGFAARENVMPIDHMSLNVANYARSKAFYEAALKPLGYKMVMELTPEQANGGAGGGLGDHGAPSFWLIQTGDIGLLAHIAFTATDRKTVDAFHAAAIAAAGKDNGGPGIRAHYHPNYYGAFVLDPDGHNIEAVCHKPE